MSWRLLFLTLVLALGASALAGMQLGDWLVQRAPVAVPAPGEDDPDPDEVVLDANGRPFMRQPPQPRVDGTLGVPEQPARTEWEISTVSLFETVKDPNVLISRNRMGAAQARELAQAAAGRLQGPQDVVTVDVARPGEGSHAPPLSGQPPLTYADPSLPGQGGQNPAAAATQPGWQQAFQAEMAKCSQAGFFERPTCAWNARNRYCAPNNAWGRVEGCPKRSF
ncbi:hypothetical protein V8Z80_10775 [Orrella sp. JC864]|uniref:hypothetical protein n=1 Tax=Orrella sp. JC864 TaxID=3120298 RepID=UPI00300A3E72